MRTCNLLSVYGLSHPYYTLWSEKSNRGNAFTVLTGVFQAAQTYDRLRRPVSL